MLESEAISQCKEMPVIPVNKVVDKKRIIRKGGQGGAKAQGVADPPKRQKMPQKCHKNALIVIKKCLKIFQNTFEAL
jgi:hypothetical protein